MTEPQDAVPTPGPAVVPATAVIIDPEGNAAVTSPTAGTEPESGQQISAPDKVMRIGTMVKQLLDEVRAAPLDDASRQRLRDIHQQSIIELADGLSPDLRDELQRLALPFSEDETPTDAELRIAQAQLVGWLEGLFHGIQAAMVSQQLAARAAMEQQGRGRALPPGGRSDTGSGQYL